YFKGEEILACEQAGVAVTLPKPQTSGAKSAGRFGKPDFVYLAEDDVYRCPAGEKLAHHFTADEDGQKMRIYLTKACRTCPLKDQCTTADERRIKRWEHEHVVEAAQTRLNQNPQAMRVRRGNRRASVRHAEDADGCDALSRAPALELGRYSAPWERNMTEVQRWCGLATI